MAKAKKEKAPSPFAGIKEQKGLKAKIKFFFQVLEDYPTVKQAILFTLFSMICGLTQFMSNTASAALLCPIGISIAKNIGADPHAVLMAIAVAASCAFATPVGTPPNTLVLGPGGYKFFDYVKAGVPLVVVSFIVSLIVIPIVWPFFP